MFVQIVQWTGLLRLSPGWGVGVLGTLVGWFVMKDRVYEKASSIHAFASHEQSGHVTSQISELVVEL